MGPGPRTHGPWTRLGSGLGRGPWSTGPRPTAPWPTCSRRVLFAVFTSGLLFAVRTLIVRLMLAPGTDCLRVAVFAALPQAEPPSPQRGAQTSPGCDHAISWKNRRGWPLSCPGSIVRRFAHRDQHDLILVTRQQNPGLPQHQSFEARAAILWQAGIALGPRMFAGLAFPWFAFEWCWHAHKRPQPANARCSCAGHRHRF